jgi:hypothetical protein
MARLVKSDVKTVIDFLRDKIDADDLPQIEEILTRNAEAGAADEDDDDSVAHVPGRAPPGAMDSRRRGFEKQHGIAPRKIRVLG